MRGQTLVPAAHDQSFLGERVSGLSRNHKYKLIRHLRGGAVLESGDTMCKGTKWLEHVGRTINSSSDWGTVWDLRSSLEMSG